MTRPKVDPEKRQRTANACDSCKRRKQKCDGKHPCSTCGKRNFKCTYAINEQAGDESSSSHTSQKRPRRDTDVTGIAGEVGSTWSPQSSKYSSESHLAYEAYPPKSNAPSTENKARTIGTFTPRPFTNQRSHDRGNDGGHEEADNHTMARMVLDPTKRLIYVGEAATISFLQILRGMVETTVGPFAFTQDPKRNEIAETHLKLPSNVHLTHQLPPKQTALILIDSYFVHLHGIVELFEEHEFLRDLHKCYSDPLSPDHVYLCHLNLVLSIGLSFATPEPGTPEEAEIESLRSKYPDQAEVFFLNAKSMSDPFVGFEDGEMWTIQALVLMALFMVTKTKRNTAAAYVGMAVRTSYALGLHREDSGKIFPGQQQLARRRLWRSLFIMDRFLASALGRPVAIAEEECSEEVLNPKATGFSQEPHISTNLICAAGLEAACRSCHVVGTILRKVYLERKISTRIAQEIADECKAWPANLPHFLHWRQASPQNRRQAIAILHVNTIYCHSVILLSRPFFIYLLSKKMERANSGKDQAPETRGRRMEQYAHACIVASSHTIAISQNAYDGRYLPKIEPFVTYALFAAALIIFANELAEDHSTALANQAMENSITIMSYCGEMDPQAKRAADILRDLQNVIVQKRQKHAVQQRESYQSHATNTAPEFQDSAVYSPVLNEGWAPMPPLPGATRPPTGDHSSASTARSHAFNNAITSLPLIHEDYAFSGLLDATNTVLPDESNPPSTHAEETIDFDSIWGLWPQGAAHHDCGGIGPSGHNRIDVVGAGGSAGTAMYYQPC